jgi:energy-converting hydrogenase Eha subunit B
VGRYATDRSFDNITVPLFWIASISPSTLVHAGMLAVLVTIAGHRHRAAHRLLSHFGEGWRRRGGNTPWIAILQY